VEELRARGTLEEEDIARIRTPAGLDIGARTPEEIALSIMAEIVSLRRARDAMPDPATAIDPVCGMEVVAAEPSLHSERGGRTAWFCGEGCKRAFEADVASF
jgi:xanthine dehydrogenase accessory factor